MYTSEEISEILGNLGENVDNYLTPEEFDSEFLGQEINIEESNDDLPEMPETEIPEFEMEVRVTVNENTGEVGIEPVALFNTEESSAVDESTARFSGAVWYNKIKESTIVLAGVGGIGSYIAFLLARMQPSRIIMYDADKVEEVNMAGQLYSTDSIGKYKVDALANIMFDFAKYSNTINFREFFTEASVAEDIMICGFDNMVARKTFYNSWKRRLLSLPKDYRHNCLFIDGRLAAEKLQVFALTGDDVENMKVYEDTWLFSDSEAEETLCSYKQTTYMANMIGSIIVNIFCNHMANLTGSPIPHDVPFMTSYEGGFMLFDTTY